MLALSRPNWAIILASKAGPAFIVGGVLLAASGILGFLLDAVIQNTLMVPVNQVNQNVDVLSQLIGSLAELSLQGITVAIYLALLVGLAAIYTRWKTVLDTLGKLGLLLAVIGFAVPIITGAMSIVSDVIDFVINITRNYGFLGILDDYYVVTLSVLADRVAIYVRWIGIVLVGIYVIRSNTNLLVGWTKSLPLIIGLWGLLAHLLSSYLLPVIFPTSISQMANLTSNPWREGLGYSLSLITSTLWVLLGMAFLSKQPKLPAQTEPGVESQSTVVSSNSGLSS
jgi:hypothetical protein